MPQGRRSTVAVLQYFLPAKLVQAEDLQETITVLFLLFQLGWLCDQFLIFGMEEANCSIFFKYLNKSATLVLIQAYFFQQCADFYQDSLAIQGSIGCLICLRWDY